VARQLCTPDGDPILECQGGGGGCFLTTACTAARGLPDDCYELAILRQFRDQYLGATEAGRQLIRRYYQIAPSICRTIDSRVNRDAIYKFVYDDLVRPSIVRVVRRDFEGARLHYEAFTVRLRDSLRVSD
jgi:hypothetical protein